MYNKNDILIMDNNQKFIIVEKLWFNDKYYYLIANYGNLNDWVIVYENENNLKEELDVANISRMVELLEIND